MSTDKTKGFAPLKNCTDVSGACFTAGSCLHSCSDRSCSVAVPVAWRQWSGKWQDWEYQTERGNLRADTPAEPLYLMPNVRANLDPTA